MVEGTVGVAVAFLLLVLMVQVAFLLSARTSAQAAVDAHVRRIAAGDTATASDLAAQVGRTLPGARDVRVSVSRSTEVVEAALSFDWDPPGPALGSTTLRLSGHAPVVGPP